MVVGWWLDGGGGHCPFVWFVSLCKDSNQKRLLMRTVGMVSSVVIVQKSQCRLTSHQRLHSHRRILLLSESLAHPTVAVTQQSLISFTRIPISECLCGAFMKNKTTKRFLWVLEMWTSCITLSHRQI